MTTVAIIQARMGSTRLPGKVLMKLGACSVLAHVVGRVLAARGVGRVVVATTDQPADAVVATEAEALGVDMFRGSEDDVLARYHDSARAFGADVIVRVTADCPLLDPDVLSAMIARFVATRHEAQPADYLSNTLVRTFPRGLDVEIFTMEALEHAYQEAAQAFEREHVTPYIYRHRDRFRCENFASESDLSSYRWTLDTIEDWRLIEAIYAALDQPGKVFGTRAVLDFLSKQPSLIALNAHVEQKPLVP